MSPPVEPLLVNAYSTLRTLPELTFPHQLNAQRDLSDPELEPHLAGFMGFLVRDDPEMTYTLQAVLRHVQRVRNHISFSVEESELNAMSAWAWDANAIIFLPHGIVDPSGAPLVPEGETVGMVPYPPDARLRKQRHDSQLTQLGINVNDGLPPVLGIDEVEFRSPEEIQARIAALAMVIAKATGGQHPAELAERATLSENEAAFMANPSPDEQAVIDHTWSAEALETLLWAVGVVDALNPTDVTADLDGSHLAEALENAHPVRDATEVLDQIDYLFRLHWAIRQAKLKGDEPPAGASASIVQERRYALNWLTSNAAVSWDSIDTPT